MLVLGWLCGVIVLTLRLMSGWLWVQRMKSHGATPAGDRWEQIALRLSRRLHIARRVRLLESTIVDVPTVIGWIKPVILVPASALSGLTPAAARGDSCARARAHPPSRLPRQPLADSRRDVAVLSPRGLVAVAPDPRGTRELLRRSCGQPLRRSIYVRKGARRSRRAARRQVVSSSWRPTADRLCSGSGASSAHRRTRGAHPAGSQGAPRFS